uniref:Tubulin--tyrosine ligase-like protein 9 n=1 Tax=Aureoumbra lagunensis TaxID=44058 RepID=A0A7S3K113_9STRA|mmetsp:Transcript_7396/g.11021  ORF Transcript_7396/g.11021 Transcript_7396/m.11021 type:complete len:365 (-) Transcript_7396:189-1283(-)
MPYYYCNLNETNGTEHILCQMLSERGWSPTRSVSEAQLSLDPSSMATINDTTTRKEKKRWIWSDKCDALSCKAMLFESLGKSDSFWPPTVVLRSVEEIDELQVNEEVFVKHPRCSGGSGTWKAANTQEAKQLAFDVFKKCKAVVIQKAIVPALLPNGPSIFELRIWSIMRGQHLFTFNKFRAKTAHLKAILMNRAIQSQESDFGQHYPWNIATEDQIRLAIGPHLYDTHTRPAILKAIEALHHSVLPHLPTDGSFFFLGLDFIVSRTEATPYFIEANIKPSYRFYNPDAQFPSPVVRDMAHSALVGLADLIHQDYSDFSSYINKHNEEDQPVDGGGVALLSSFSKSNKSPHWLSHASSLLRSSH